MPNKNTLAVMLAALFVFSGCVGRLATEEHEIGNAYKMVLLQDLRGEHFNNCMNWAEGWDIPLHMAHNIKGCEDIVQSQFDPYRREYESDSRWRRVR